MRDAHRIKSLGENGIPNEMGENRKNKKNYKNRVKIIKKI